MDPTRNPDPQPEPDPKPELEVEGSGWNRIGSTDTGGTVYFASPGTAVPLSPLEPLEPLPDVIIGRSWTELRQAILRQHGLNPDVCPMCGATAPTPAPGPDELTHVLIVADLRELASITTTHPEYAGRGWVTITGDDITEAVRFDGSRIGRIVVTEAAEEHGAQTATLIDLARFSRRRTADDPDPAPERFHP